MLTLNFGTVLLHHFLVQLVCAVVITALWRSNRSRYDGLGLWVADFWLLTAAMALLLLRGNIPLFVSAVGGNALVMAGVTALYAGLARFAAMPAWPMVNLAMLPVFLLTHSYLTLISPSLALRTANASLFLALYCGNIILLLRRYPPELRPLARPAVYAVTGLAAVSLARALINFRQTEITDLFTNYPHDTVLFMLYSGSMVALVYGLFLMVNKRLLADTTASLTARTEAEKALDNALKVAKLGTWRWDIKNGQLAWSEEMYSIFGLNKQTFTGDLEAVIAAAIHPEDRPAVEASNRRVIKEGLPAPLEYRVLWPDGSVHWVYAEASELLKDADGRTLALKGYAQDITARKKAEETLRKSEERLSLVFRTAPYGITITTLNDARILDINDAFSAITGYSRKESVGRTTLELNLWKDPLERKALIRELLSGPVRHREASFRNKNGGLFAAELSSELLELDGQKVMITSIKDISETKKAEAAIHTAQRLESLGTLAGGIAHDFNNLLTGITGNLSLIRASSAAGRDIGELTYEAEAAASAARSLARQLLTFATGGEPMRAAIEFPAVVKDAVAFSLRGSGTRHSVAADEELTVLADREQLFQVFQNLTLNAAHAMAGRGEVKVSIRAETLNSGAFPGLPAGRYAAAAVSDSGGGMPPEVLRRIFDPYFSTKGQGRGLGLAVCRSVVSKHGGHIDVVSEPGNGSTFTVYLPLTEARPAPAGAPASPVQFAGSGRVLVMDDEVIVWKALKRMLTALGYEAALVGDGVAAISAWESAEKAGKPFSAVIMDLTIPGGMGGAEAVKLLKSKFPAAKVLVSSGYAEDPVMSDYAARGFDGALSKPYRLEDLEAMLKKLLR